MARKEIDTQSEPTPGGKPGGISHSDEFDKAVTEELSVVLRRGRDEDLTAGTSDLKLVDSHLRADVAPPDDGAFGPGFVLKDRFEIVELVRSGGMSHVYKAIDHRRHPEGSGGVHVAIKMMRPSIASQQDACLALEREAAKAQALSHPNIINIFDFDEHDDQFFLVMEWLDGESLNALLRRTSGRGLPRQEAWALIEGLAAAVQHAHEKGVVHADINPSNIFITEDQGVKLLDFGVARVTSGNENLVDGQFAWVTQTYSSPEVLSGHVPVFEDDVFSLGCVAYRVLSGRHPFSGASSLAAKQKGYVVEPIPGLAEDEWQVLRRSLSYDGSKRPGSAGAFVTRTDTRWETSPFIAGLKSRDWSQLRTRWLVVAAAALAVGGWWLTRPGGDGDMKTPDVASAAEEAVASAPVAPLVLSPVPNLVLAGQQALGEGRLVSPEDANARGLFLEVLVLEPDNVDALHGLRAISDNYVQQAHAALNADDPAQAYGALSIATETDPQNPAIELVSQLLVTKGSAELAAARLAAAAGNFDLVAERLERAERYENIDLPTLQSIRAQVNQKRADENLRAGLAAAGTHISAGRLISPQAGNAHALLLELYAAHGDDARLVAAMERLGDRLLTRAVFSAAAERFDEATRLLDAVDALGVLAPEVELARISFSTPPEPIASGKMPEPEQDLANNEIDIALADEPIAVVAASGTEEQVLRRTVQELGIEQYIAPEYPGRALRRGITGTVDVRFRINADGSIDAVEIVEAEPGNVFANSALEAVRQWRFAPRDAAIQAKITLKFELAR